MLAKDSVPFLSKASSWAGKEYNMYIRKFAVASAAFLAVAHLGGCGGSSGNSPPPPPPPPPPVPAGPLLAVGPLQSGGNFVIGDVNIDTSRSQVVINGSPGTLLDLMPGQVLGIVGSTDMSGQSSADQIFFNANVIGPVDSVDLSANQLVVMGQPVTVNADSILSTPLANFAQGEVVQVSGYTDSTGQTIASRIDYSVNSGEGRLIGVVTNLDSANFTFTINGLSLDYSSALSIDVPGGQLRNGLEIEVTGGRSLNGVFQVTTIENFDRDLMDNAGAQVRAEGRITAAVSGSEFSINGFPIVMGGQRDYRQGSAADIAVGVKVRLEGIVLADGTVQIHRVWFLRN